MREVLVVSSSGDASPMDESAQDDDDVIGCLPRLFAPGHKDEVLKIISSLSALLLKEGDKAAHELEVQLERYQKLLDLYQEQPTLLDCSIPSMLQQLLDMVTLPQGGECRRLDHKSATALRFAFHLTKVRGHKVMVRQLPHEVKWLAPLLACLEAYTNTVSSDLPERSMLLLWLTIVAKNPFDLRRFDGTANEGATMRRIFAIALPYLDAPWNRSTHYAASLLLAESLARLDGHPHIAGMVERTLERVRTASNGDSNGASSSAAKLSQVAADECLGPLTLLLAIMKKVDRAHLSPHTESICEMTKRFFPLCPSENALVKKCAVKCIQRTALIVLRPRLAAWRYTRGKRRIEENLKMAMGGGEKEEEEDKGVIGSTNGVSSVAGKKRKANGAENRQQEEEDEVDEAFVQHQNMMAWIVDCLLRALADTDTAVRWSAAKGVGRLASRLPKALATQIVQSILQSKFHRLAGNSSWHGGCLALAELSRRGCLLPALLPEAFSVVRAALFFQEPSGKFALGSNVRDAACYVVWAWARAYDAAELAPRVAEIAAELMCVALFDREVSIRRAASAAFQENVGRQRTFPDGIALITIADYFAVGNRTRCFTSLACQVAAYPRYTRHLIDHLIEQKVTHWDERMREQTATCLGQLVERDVEHSRECLIKRILPGLESKSVMDRQGFMLAAAEVYAGLNRTEGGWKGAEEERREVEDTLAALAARLHPECSTTGKGSEVTKHGAAVALRTLAEARCPLQEDHISQWLSFFVMLATDATHKVAAEAAECARPFIENYINGHEALERMTMEGLSRKLSSGLEERIRVGAALLAAWLRPEAIVHALFEALAGVIRSRSDLDKEWAMARKAAVKAITTAGRSEDRTRVRQAVQLLAAATEDYTQNKMGDIGRVVREEAMKGFATLATQGLMTRDEIVDALQRMVQQSAEKITYTRMVACECIQSLLASPLAAPHLPCPKLLGQVYADLRDFQACSDKVLGSLSPLLESPDLRMPLLEALVQTAGTFSESTERVATEAIVEYLKTADDESHLTFLALLADRAGDRLPRISTAALRVLPRMLVELRCIETESPPPALHSLLSTLARITAKSAAPSRVRHSLESLSTLMSALPRTNPVWRTAAKCCVAALRSQFPAIRRCAAEALYEGLCVTAEEEDDEALQTLAETPWQDKEDMVAIERAGRLVHRKLLGED